MSKDNRPPLSIPGVAGQLGCSVDHVRNLIAAGELQAVDIALGKRRARWVVPDDELRAFIARRQRQPAKPSKPRKVAPSVTREWV